MAYKKKEKKQKFIALKKFKADINNVVIKALKGEEISLIANEAMILKELIKEK